MAIPKNTIGDRDRGKRLYIGNDPYQSRMRKRTIAEYDRNWQKKQSEAKKPYRETDYPNMEYKFDPWLPVIPPHTPPTFPDDPYAPPVDGPPPTIYPGNPGKPGEIPPFLGCDFLGNFSPAVITPGELAYAQFVMGSEETGIRELEVSGPVDLFASTYIKGLTGPGLQANRGSAIFTFIVQAWPAAKILADPRYNNVEGNIYYQVQVRTNSYFAPRDLPAAPGQIERPNPWYSFGVCAARGYVTPCPAPITLEWDSETSPQTMGRNDDVTVAVIGGIGPYTWTVSGEGFSLLYEETSGVYESSNLLSTDGTACGSAVITVTDACGDECQGEVRCTIGNWYAYDGTPFCAIPGPADSGPSGADSSCSSGMYVRTLGKWKQQHCYMYSTAYTTCPNSCEDLDCGGNCFNEATYCHQVYGCSGCLTWDELGWQYTNYYHAGGNCLETELRCTLEGLEHLPFQYHCQCVGDYSTTFSLQEWDC